MDLSIIIVNFNTFQLTCNCIASVFSHVKDLTFEVILIDNNSSDQHPASFKEKFPSIHLLGLKENIGFGPANNMGMKIASGRYFLLLNSDTLIIDDSIQKCYQFMESPSSVENNIGVLGCKLLNPDRTFQLSVFPYQKNSLWRYLLTTNPIAEKLVTLAGYNRHHSFDENKIQPVGDISGAFMFIRKAIAQKTNYFDTDFFMYCEDTEWCRERLAKITRLIFYPEARIIHIGGQSAPQNIMYVQSKLSLSLLWYKKGMLAYLGYLMFTLVNILTMISCLLFIKKETRQQFIRFIRAYCRLFPYFISDIPQYPRKMNSRKKKLIYREALTLTTQAGSQ